MPAIKSIVNDMESESHQSTTTDHIADDQLLQEPSSPISMISNCSSLNLCDKDSSPKLSFVQRLYKAASFIFPSSTSTPKIRDRSDINDSLSDTAMLQHCSDISAAKMCLDSTERQQRLLNTSSLCSDVDADSDNMDNDLRVSRCPSPMSSSSPELPPPALNHSLASQLKDAQYRISSFSSAKHQLQKKVQQEINNNTLSSWCNELTEECDTLRAQLMSLQLERENSQF